jgi:uncharacterized membrane protein
LKAKDRTRIAQAIAAAEEGTSGTIAVRIVNERHLDALGTAKSEFERLKMHHHPPRNAALILIAPRARQFALIGDRALHERVGDAFWNQLTGEMRSYFVYDQIVEGIVAVVERLGQAFRTHFAENPPA